VENNRPRLDKEFAMNEDFSREEWAANHLVVSTGIANALKQIGIAMKKLNAYQYDAPWRKRAAKTNECGCR
jgi:hypothetical protein